MRRFRGIVQTNKEPEDKEILWYKNKELLFFNNGEWQPFINSTISDTSNLVTKEYLDYNTIKNVYGYNYDDGNAAFHLTIERKLSADRAAPAISIAASKGITISKGFSLNGMTSLILSPDTNVLATKEDINTLKINEPIVIDSVGNGMITNITIDDYVHTSIPSSVILNCTGIDMINSSIIKCRLTDTERGYNGEFIFTYESPTFGQYGSKYLLEVAATYNPMQPDKGLQITIIKKQLRTDL